MNILYVILGIVSLAFGIRTIIRQLRIFARGKQDKYGFDIKILVGGIGFLILGTGLILAYT